MLITNHRFIEQYPIAVESKKLVVGTIHPHDYENFKLDFFYGGSLSIWNILNEVYEGEIGNINLKNVLRFLTNNKIAFTDIIVKCQRNSDSALDKHLKPLELNSNIISQIQNSNIDTIYFTSGFSKNSAFKLFYKDLLKKTITSEIRFNRETVLDSSLFGRAIKIKILFSPSGTANSGIVKSKEFRAVEKQYRNSSATPVKDFRIDYYKKAFRG